MDQGLTDAQLIDRAHALLLSCMKGEIDFAACVVELTGLLEENGRPFIGRVDYIEPAND